VAIACQRVSNSRLWASAASYLDGASLLNLGRWQEAGAGVDGAGRVIELKGCSAVGAKGQRAGGGGRQHKVSGTR
jgi:hypothetical protein